MISPSADREYLLFATPGFPYVILFCLCQGTGFPPGKMVKPWRQHREKITELYIKEAKTLDETKRIMDEDFGFIASCVFLFPSFC